MKKLKLNCDCGCGSFLEIQADEHSINFCSFGDVEVLNYNKYTKLMKFINDSFFKIKQFQEKITKDSMP